MKSIKTMTREELKRLADEGGPDLLFDSPEQIRALHWVQFPMKWFNALRGASGSTYHVAIYLLYLHWRGHGREIKIANKMLNYDGVSRQSKWRALDDLKRRGLITMKREFGKSPKIRIYL